MRTAGWEVRRAAGGRRRRRRRAAGRRRWRRRRRQRLQQALDDDGNNDGDGHDAGEVRQEYTPLGRAQVRQLVPPMLQQPARRLLLREPVFARLEVEPVLQSKPQHPRGTEYLYTWALFTAFT